MKDNDLLVTELYRDPTEDAITALSVYLTPKTSTTVYILFITTNINLQFCMDCCHSIKGWQLHVYFFSSGRSAAHMFVELWGVEWRFKNCFPDSKLFYVDDLRTGENRFFVKPFFWAAFFNKKWIFFLEKQNKKSESFIKKHFQENFSQKKRENQENIFWKFLKFF